MFLVTLLIGLLLLVAGAELVVRGGGQLALAMRVPALIVGLTIVAFGTSAPELGVSIAAAVKASTDMALANVIGSNIANIALVLGLSALVRPILVDRRLARREVPVCIGLQVLIPLFAWNGVIGRVEGAALLLVGVVYNVLLVMDARRRRARVMDDDEDTLVPEGSPLFHLFLLFLGIAIIVAGAYLFVSGAEAVAYKLGLSQRYVGLTVVALGTSAPEVATSVVSSYRNQGEMAVGNVVGSNIFNVTLVLAVTAMIQPVVLGSEGASVDFAVALGLTVLLLPIVLTERLLGRVEGAVLAGGYVAFLIFTPM